MKLVYGYNEDSLANILWAVDYAYELIDNKPEIDTGLLKARDIIHQMLQESRLP